MKNFRFKVLLHFLFFLCFFFINKNYTVFAFYNGNDILSESVLMVNNDTQMIVFDKNADKRRSIASLTKIMAYIAVYENVKDVNSEKVIVKSETLSLIDKDSSIAGLRPNDEITVLNLLHCLMICSGGDAAYVLAEYIGNGDISKFVDVMNNKARELGCKDTNFVNPDGIYNENHYSTAKDIYTITKYAMSLPLFMEICNKTEYNVFNDERATIKTTNKMLNPFEKDYYYPYVKGIKTGYHSEAGRCFVSCAEKNNTSYTCIVLGAPLTSSDGNQIKENIAMIDTKKLYIWAFDNLVLKSVINRNDPLGQVRLKYAWRKDRLLFGSEAPVMMVLPKDVKLSDLKTEFFIPDLIKAPISSGDFIGTARFSYNGKFLNEINIVSSESVSFNFFVFVLSVLKMIIFSKLFLIILILSLIVLVIYVYILVISNKKGGNKKKKRNYKYKDKDKYRSNKRK